MLMPVYKKKKTKVQSPKLHMKYFLYGFDIKTTFSYRMIMSLASADDGSFIAKIIF